MQKYICLLGIFVLFQVGIYYATRQTEHPIQLDTSYNKVPPQFQSRIQVQPQPEKEPEPPKPHISPREKERDPKEYNLYPKPPAEYTCSVKPPSYIQNHTDLYCVEYDSHIPSHVQQIPKERPQTFWFSDTCEPTLEFDQISKEHYWKSYSKCTYYMPEPADETVPPEGEWLCFPKVISFSPPRAGTTTFWDIITDHPLLIKSNYDFKEPNWWGGWAQNSKFVGPDGFISYLKALCPAREMVPVKEGAEAIEKARREGTVPTYCSDMICGDWSTWYSYRNHKETLQRVKKTIPDAIVVVHLRDPVFRQQSYTNLPGAIPPKDKFPDGEAYATHIIDQIETINKDALKKFPKLSENGPDYSPLGDIDFIRSQPVMTSDKLMGNWGRMGISLYWLFLEPLLQEYTLNQNIYVSMLEELVADRQKFSEEVWRYIGVNRYYSDWNSLKTATSHLHDSSKDIKSQLRFPPHFIDTLHEFYRPHDEYALQLLGWPREKFPWLMNP